MKQSKPSHQKAERKQSPLLVLAIPAPTILKVELAANLALEFLRILPWALNRSTEILQQASAALVAAGLEEESKHGSTEPSEAVFVTAAKALMVATMAGAWASVTDSDPWLSPNPIDGSLELRVVVPPAIDAERRNPHPVDLLSGQTLYFSLNLPDDEPDTIVIGVCLGQKGSRRVYEPIGITEVDRLPDCLRQMTVQVCRNPVLSWLHRGPSRNETSLQAKRKAWSELKEWMEVQLLFIESLREAMNDHLMASRLGKWQPLERKHR